MDLMPRYKQTEVGAIPEDWNVGLLDSVARRGSGHTPDKSHPEYWGGQVKWISLQDSHRLDRLYISDTNAKITPAGLANSSAKLHPAGTVVLSRDAGVGKSAIMTDCMAVSQHFMAWVCGSSLNNRFLFYWLQANKPEFERIAMGNTIKTIGLSYFRQLRVPLPCVTEQEAIAEALSDTDALVESLENLIAKKRQLKEGVMQELLSGKRRLPGVDRDWAVKPLGSLFSFSGGYSASRDQLSGEGHCYLHYGDIHKSSKTFIDLRAEYQDIPKLNVPLKRVSSASLLSEGDVVFVDASEDDEGASRHVVIANQDTRIFIAGLHTIVAKSLTEDLANEYRRYCFQTTAVREQFLFYAVGTKVSGISKTNIAKITIPIPTLPEQIAIADILISMDTNLAALEAKVGKARQIKKGMMQELLTGRIRLV